MPRLAKIERALLREPRGGVAVLVGEGGLGKSVLLGQVLDRVDARDDRWPWSCAVLVSCVRVVLDGPSRLDADDIDREFARGADVPDGGLLDLLAAMRAAHSTPVLLVDTLDLLLTEATFRAIADFLARATSVCDVLVTCRTYEFEDYFTDLRTAAPQLCGRVRAVPVPELTASEIVEWTRAYLTRDDTEPDAAQQAFLDALRGGMERPSSLQRVCAVPVRLALTWEIFSGTGRVPEDLTVTGLYRSYWKARILRHRDGRSGSAAALRKEAAALAAAAQVVTPTGRIALRVPKGAIAPDHRWGTTLLVSEGVLRDADTGWEFFHQTFAEFAYARWLLMQPDDAAALTALLDGVRSGRRNLWPVVRSLLLQTDGADDFRRLTASVPADDPEGARIHVVAAMARADPDLLTETLARVEQTADAAAAVLPILADVPAAHLDVAFDSAVRQLRRRDPARITSVGPAARTLASLLPRYAPGQLPQRLSAALDALLTVKPDVPGDAWEHHVAKLFDGFATTGLPDDALREVWARYRPLEHFGRCAALRVLLARPGSVDVAAARAALAERCPPLHDDEQRRLFELLWGSPAVRDDRGWTRVAGHDRRPATQRMDQCSDPGGGTVGRRGRGDAGEPAVRPSRRPGCAGEEQEGTHRRGEDRHTGPVADRAPARRVDRDPAPRCRSAAGSAGFRSRRRLRTGFRRGARPRPSTVAARLAGPCRRGATAAIVAGPRGARRGRPRPAPGA